MRSIQDVGTEILKKEVKALYIFGGPEYGIKMKYIDMIKPIYKEYIELTSMIELLSSLNSKSLIPRPQTLYVIRYDEEFVSKLDAKLAQKIKATKIPGTIIMIYDNDKHITKLDKLLPEYTVMISKVDNRFVFKYLQGDFPELNEEYLKLATHLCNDYNEGRLLCNSISMMDKNILQNLSSTELSTILGKSQSISETLIKASIGTKSMKLICDILEKDSEYDSILYTMLSSFLDLEKSLNGGKSDMDQYKSYWTLENVYNMFIHTFNTLSKLRSMNINAKDQIVFLFALMQLKNIPSYEVI